MLDKMNDIFRNNLQFKVLTFISLIALGFVSLGGTAFADVVSANPGDDIEFTFDQRATYSVKLRYWAQTTDKTAVAGTDYDKIDGWVEVEAGASQIKVKTKTYDNADATSSLDFDLELSDPQYYAYGEWKNATADDKLVQLYEAIGRIIY